MSAAPLLTVDDLSVAHGAAPTLDGASFSLAAGGSLALVGESGCGKTTTALALAGLLPDAARLTGGSIRLAGRELTGLSERQWRALRGRELAMVFQNPGGSLNPALTIRAQLATVLRRAGASRATARRQAPDLLQRAGLGEPTAILGARPHELSGGQCQRVMIAMALACRPRLLIADEPTSALDVTTQAAVMARLDEMTAEAGAALLLITHDLGLAARHCERVAVMYCGRVVEAGPVATVFERPRHPYTAGLLAAVPRLDAGTAPAAIPGQVPPPGERPPGCHFEPRCPRATAQCRRERPELPDTDDGAACFHPLETQS